MSLLLTGTEELSFELSGSVREPCLELPPALSRPRGPLRVALTVFRMRGLRVAGLPGPGVDYMEALWRVAVLHEGAPVWLAVACDLDSALVRVTGRALIRYPVRAAALALAPTGFEVRAAGARLAVELDEREPAPPAPPAPPLVPLLVASGARLWRVPWAEVRPRDSERCQLRVSEDTLAGRTLGAITWDPFVERLTGRGHRCGRAVRID